MSCPGLVVLSVAVVDSCSRGGEVHWEQGWGQAGVEGGVLEGYSIPLSRMDIFFYQRLFSDQNI